MYSPLGYLRTVGVHSFKSVKKKLYCWKVFYLTSLKIKKGTAQLEFCYNYIIWMIIKPLSKKEIEFKREYTF